MAWQRNIPFGYDIRGGQLITHPQESEAVKSIFSLYLAGLSYSKIAGEMMRRGISYHKHTPDWNKHMVKRILENRRYLGADDYPPLVSEEDYLSAQRRKKDKTTYAPSPAVVEPIREKCRCGVCGAPMMRDTKTHGRARWCCENSACGNRLAIPDEELRARVLERLSALARAPHLRRLNRSDAGKALSMEPIRLENEINHEFNRADANPEYLRVLILACTVEKYNELPDLTPRHRVEQLLERLEGDPADEAALQSLLTEAVHTVRIGRNGTITLALTDGQIFERTEETL